MTAGIVVNPQGFLTFQDKKYRCALGKNGVVENKEEGDLCTPQGVFALRQCYYRPDRLAPPLTALPCVPLSPTDGWCDDPKHFLYNRHVTLPFTASHETLWREDALYDIIMPLGYNDDPVVPGRGSAIFLHVASPEYEDTEGCVALMLADLLAVLAGVVPGTTLTVTSKSA